MELIIVAGNFGVYAGWAAGGLSAIDASGRVELSNSRHMRRYYTTGRSGTGSAGDLARLGLDPSSPSIGECVGRSVFLCVMRAFVVDRAVVDTFGCPRP